MARSPDLRTTAAAAAATAGAVAAGKIAHDRLTGRGERRTYRFLPGETLPDAVVRVARGRVDHALDELGGKTDSDSETAVHEARKDMKKLRALVRLVRDEIGDDAYRRENDAFREVAGRLSGARDADVMLETLTRLSDDRHAKAHAGLRKALKEHRQSLEGTESGRRQMLDDARSDLKQARARVEDWELDRDSFEALELGLRRVYRRGRRALAAVEDDRTTENLHEWRKRAKDLWYSLRLLRDSWPGPMSALTDEADGLADLLGEDHDLAVLVEAAREREAALGPSGLDGLERAVSARREELQTGALELGRRLYAEKPGAFVARSAAWWNAGERARIA